MKKEYEIFLPFPPSVNTYYSVYRGRKRLSKKGRQYKDECLSVIHELGFNGLKLDYRFGVTITLNPPCNRRRDLDNFTKAPLDAITNSGFWVDDRLIDDLRIIRGVKSNPGHIHLIIRKL